MAKVIADRMTAQVQGEASKLDLLDQSLASLSDTGQLRI